jgi:hypothetical protein
MQWGPFVKPVVVPEEQSAHAVDRLTAWTGMDWSGQEVETFELWRGLDLEQVDLMFRRQEAELHASRTALGDKSAMHEESAIEPGLDSILTASGVVIGGTDEAPLLEIDTPMVFPISWDELSSPVAMNAHGNDESFAAVVAADEVAGTEEVAPEEAPPAEEAPAEEPAEEVTAEAVAAPAPEAPVAEEEPAEAVAS